MQWSDWSSDVCSSDLLERNNDRGDDESVSFHHHNHDNDDNNGDKINGDGHVQSSQPHHHHHLNYIIVIVGSHRRVNITALQNVVEQELLLSYHQHQNQLPPSVAESCTSAPPQLVSRSNHDIPKNIQNLQLAPRNQVESLCGFSPGTVPPILGWNTVVGTTTTTES